MAVLADYLRHADEADLSDFLDQRVFKDAEATTLQPVNEDVAGFNAFLNAFLKAMPVERAAITTVAQ